MVDYATLKEPIYSGNGQYMKNINICSRNSFSDFTISFSYHRKLLAIKGYTGYILKKHASSGEY